MKTKEKANKRPLNGVIPALITPFTPSGEIDTHALEKQVTYLKNAGATGFLIGGSTAEGAYLSSDERCSLVEMTGSFAGSDLLLCAASLAPTTQQVIEDCCAFSRYSPDYYVAVPPYYLPVDQQVVVQHFTAIAENVDAPVIIYHIPQNTMNGVTLETIQELEANKNIAGIKDSSGDFSLFTKGLLASFETVTDEFAWLQGSDVLDGPSLLFGAAGLVTGLGNVMIEPYIKMYCAADRKDIEGVKRAQTEVFHLLRIIEAVNGKGIPAIKCACELLGRGTGAMKIDSMTLSHKEQEKIGSVLRELGLLE